MLAQLTDTSVSTRWQERLEPWIPRPGANPNASARHILKTIVGIGAAVLAIVVVVSLRIVLTAHLVPRWHEALAHFLPFLNGG
jgi:hypothetical protein